jgi:hypothetical protein
MVYGPAFASECAGSSPLAVSVEQVAPRIVKPLEIEQMGASWFAVCIGEVRDAPEYAVALAARFFLPPCAVEVCDVMRHDRREVEIGRQVSARTPLTAAPTSAESALLGAIWRQQ